ncbi:MAG: squalene--hopene cyclase [Polyangiales bacterium]
MTITEAQEVLAGSTGDSPVPTDRDPDRASSTASVSTRRGDTTTARERGETIHANHTRVHHAIDGARDWLFSQQQSTGFWCADLEGDITLESYMILLEAFLGRRASPRSRELAGAIRAEMLPAGGWSQYPGGPAEISVSCLGYFALKLCGDSADAEHMARSRDVILSLGGVERANTYTQYHLAFFGQFAWADVPAIPPEMIFLPQRGPFSIYDMSSWSRTIFIPLAILYAHKPVIEIPAEHGVPELFTHRRESFFGSLKNRSIDAAGLKTRDVWKAFFLGVDRALKSYEKLPGSSALRDVALRRAAGWMTQRFAHSDGLSAILPAMANSVMALKILGYSEDHPMMREQLQHLDELLTRDKSGALRMQPCVSPVWDTVLSMRALIQSGVAKDDERLQRAATWLLMKQTRHEGDWAGKNRAEPGGWYFEYRNEFYPDVDDTSMALMVLQHARADVPESEQRAAVQRGLRWLLGMQNDDGGWAAFDRNNDKHFLTQVPFADHNAMIDPSTADITGRALECLSHFAGYDVAHPVVQRAVRFLYRDQLPDGSWYGRWGVNYLYGTWQALKGLRAIGADMQTPQARRAVRFLVEHQNADGGWGESIASYDHPEQKAQGPSTPSQTAWAMMGLISANETAHPAVQRGLQYLLDTQDDAGTWEQPQWTGTGFPKVFYLNYPLYRHYFPLMALSQYVARATET